ncbi:hypothetical protein GCM10026983_21180 [Gracilibacillus alcaliphilus]
MLNGKKTVQAIVDKLLQPVEHLEYTGDTLQYGSLEQTVNKMTVSFMPSVSHIHTF